VLNEKCGLDLNKITFLINLYAPILSLKILERIQISPDVGDYC